MESQEVFLIICEDQQCSRMREGRDLATRSTGQDGLIGSVTSAFARTHTSTHTAALLLILTPEDEAH